MTTASDAPPPVPTDRYRRFRAALALSETTARAFAAGLGVTEDHLYLVAKGKRGSRRIEAAIDTLILEAR